MSRITVPYLHWKAGMFPDWEFEFVGYEFTGSGPFPTGVELRRLDDEIPNMPDSGYAHQLFK